MMRTLPHCLSVLLGIGLLAALAPSGAGAVPVSGFVISEVLFEPPGGNNRAQWIELYNGTGAAIDLSSYSLGWGRTDYLRGTFQLSGTLLPGATWVVGGPISNAGNGNPVYDQAQDLDKDLRKGNKGTTDGVALFDVPAASIVDGLAPIHTVIYGQPTATTVLIDEQGATASLLVATDALVPGYSIEFDGTIWSINSTPSPGVVIIPVPEPGTALLLGLGLGLLGLRARSRSRRP